MTNVSTCDLKIPLKTGIAKTTHFDFARFKYLGVPTKNRILDSILANRDDEVKRWFKYFQNDNEYSDSTKWGYIHDFIKFVRLCDKHRVIPASELAVIVWERHLVEQVRLEGMNINSARKLISSIKTILTRINSTSLTWFSSYSLFRSEVHATKGYSDRELAQLIRVIHTFFRQIAPKIIDKPDLYINAGRRTAVGSFKYSGKEISISGAVTKCFCAAYFLLSYYTFSNSSTILKMVKTAEEKREGRIWFEQSVLKPRANKFVSISIGDNGTFNVPKYALSFFELLLKLSSLISLKKHLLYCCESGNIRSLEFNHVQGFSQWIQKTFKLLNDSNEPLKALNRKFRVSGSYRYLTASGSEIDTSILLGNTPQVLKRHYSTGNESDNNQQLSAAAMTLENAVKCSDIDAAKNQTRIEMDVEVLPYELFQAKYSVSKAEKTVLGTGCKNPYDDENEKFKRKMNFSPKSFAVENLACADIVNCFFCKNQVIIESIEDIWCLLSFKQSIEESKQTHLNESQFVKNFADLLEQINLALFQITPSIKRKAEQKLEREGRHPLWPEDLNLRY